MEINPVVFAKALADDTRQRIMTLLCCQWLCVSDIVESLNDGGEGVAQPTVSHHLSILKDAGLVSWQRDGKQIMYTLNQEQVAICCGRVMLNFAPESTMAAGVAEQMGVDT